ncbi:MAG: exodeoxyribonuclease VII large subunit, partial [Coriobacteriia bacterium]|nr:exodeoxyribonuclease VII large subunit [Coriobacteriia bacterium]
VGSASQALDLAAIALNRAIPERLRRDSERLEYVRADMARIGPRIQERAEDAVGRAATRLDDLSPLKILGRGYAVCFGPDGRTVVTSYDQVAVGDRVDVRISDGTIGCVVETKEKGS